MSAAFYSYIKNHIKTIAAVFLMFLSFGLILYLNQIPVDLVLYGWELTCVIFLLFGLLDFIRFYRSHCVLCQMRDTVGLSLDDLPAAHTIVEEDYQVLLTLLQEEKAFLVSCSDKKNRETIDYYTLWAHQIKTPISAAKLILQSESFSPMELEQELFKIEQYVDMVLNYLRLDTMSQDMLIKEYSLDSVVKQAIKKYSVVFFYKKLTLSLKELDTTVLTDEKWLTFVIEQLLSNACKYTSSGEISIYMDSEKKQQGLDVLVIQDTGIGIRPEDIPRIFDRGFTGYNGRMDKKSTGIGLYLTKQILDKLSHPISIYSAPGKGTKVYINFSANRADYLHRLPPE
ncbi:sensor histidine kinase [Anaerolentibacter hominis]|uniref:sensor histidine kinase n=1 Tax=Anaerolentibacter hominis TaxID=3079009 RepID=UPI0031B80E32